MESEAWPRRINRVAPNGTKFSYPPPQQLMDQPVTADPSGFLEASLGEDEECLAGEEMADGKLYIVSVLCSHLDGENAEVSQFARTLAGQGKRIGVLNLSGRTAHLRYYCQSEESRQARTTASAIYWDDEEAVQSVLADAKKMTGDVLPQLDRLAEYLDYLLICCGPEYSGFDRRLYDLVDSVCVIASPERQKLIDSYQVLKTFAGQTMGNASAGVFVANVDCFARAQAVYAKIAETARKHMDIEIENFGYALPSDDVVCTPLSRMNVKGNGSEWTGRLEKWLGMRAGDDRLDEAMNETMPKQPDVMELLDLEKADDRKEIRTGNRLPEPRIETQPEMPSADGAVDDLQIVDLPEGEAVSLAEYLGHKLLFNWCAVKDQLFRFLRSAGIDCVKFENADGRGTLVVVLAEGGNTEGLDWALENFPKNDDRLLIVSDRQIGRMEKTRWTKYFGTVEIRRMIKGRLGGREVMILERA